MFLEGLLRRKGILTLMVGIALLCGIAPANGLAMPIDSQPLIQSAPAQSAYLEKVQTFLDKEIVQTRLSKLGLSTEAAKRYISRLDQTQLKRLSQRIDSVEAGGDGATAIIALLVILLIVMSVLYFADYRVKLEPRNE